MNTAELQKKLIAAARVHAPGDRVPYAFEKRIMALLAGRAVADYRALWARGLWRAAISCAAVAVLFAAVTMVIPLTTNRSADLSQDFETTLLASINNQADETP